MAKISAKKLIKELDNIDVGNDTTLWNEAKTHVINEVKDIIRAMEHEAKAKKKADKVVGVGDTDSPKEISPVPMHMLMQYGLFLSQTPTILSSGKGKKIYSVGDKIPIMYLGKPVDFDIVEVADHGIKLISHDILAFQPFDINGSNVYDKSSIKDYLENEFEKCFDAEFIKLLNGNKFYLPLEEEIKNTYLYHDKRTKRYKGKPMLYWLSTPYNSDYNTDDAAIAAINVFSDGSISLNYVYGAGGVAPAVIIGRLD